MYPGRCSVSTCLTSDGWRRCEPLALTHRYLSTCRTCLQYWASPILIKLLPLKDYKYMIFFFCPWPYMHCALREVFFSFFFAVFCYVFCIMIFFFIFWLFCVFPLYVCLFGRTGQPADQLLFLSVPSDSTSATLQSLQPDTEYVINLYPLFPRNSATPSTLNARTRESERNMLEP